MKWTPTLEQVAARLAARTRIDDGDLAGTFNSETEPTDEQAIAIIKQAVAFLEMRLGPMAERLESQANALATLRAAYMVELAFFPEQAETGMSPYNALRMEFKDALADYDIVAKGMEPGDAAHIASLKVGTDYPGYEYLNETI